MPDLSQQGKYTGHNRSADGRRDCLVSCECKKASHHSADGNASHGLPAVHSSVNREVKEFDYPKARPSGVEYFDGIVVLGTDCDLP